MSDFEMWKDRLTELLHRAAGVAEGGDDAAAREIRAELRQFIADSRPNTPEIRALDKIANEAGDALAQSSVDARIAALAARTRDLAGLGKQLEAAAESVSADARSLRLERERKAALSLSDAIASLKDLKASLEDGVDGETLGKVSGLVSAMQKFRESLES